MSGPGKFPRGGFAAYAQTSCGLTNCSRSTPNLPTSIVGFGGFDSSTILILRGGIPRPIGIS